MKYNHTENLVKGAFMALLAVTLTAGPSLAQTTYDLCASDGSITINGDVSPIWGYADITGGGPCGPGMATLPGPVLTAADGETLTINLFNALSVPVSIFIPGLPKNVADQLAPQTTLDLQGRERLTSMDETVAPGGNGTYIWTANEGTYLYESGTDIRTQVPMGMYGALVVSGPSYPPVAQDEVLVFSEIDPALNADPANFGGARVSNWISKYFLINGAAYPNTADLAVDVSSNVLLRFVNAGLQTFVPTLGGGLFMDVIAEDGNLYPYPVRQYGLELQAGKTYDAVINAGSPGTYKLYDRSGHLSNGGLIIALQAGVAAGAPTANDDVYATSEDTGFVEAAPGVLANDTPGTGGTMTASLVADVANGSLVLNVDGSFTYTPDPDFSGNDMFTYVANDGGPNSNVATATIEVSPVNDSPVAVADGYDAVEGVTLNVAAPGVLTNDVDVDGDTLTVTTTPVIAPPVGAVLTLGTDGSFDYTPAGTAGAVETFDYEACDPALACSTATVTINVVAPPANIAPTANDDTTSTPRGTALVNYNIVANDTDPDGTIDATSVVITTGAATQRGGTVVNNGDGTITYSTPNPGWRGTDSFQYTVNDNDGATSNVATVNINVVR